MVRKVTLTQVDQLAEKFKLQEFEIAPNPWLLSETIVPITNVDKILCPAQAVGATASVSATGIKNYDIVPVGETWYVQAVQAVVVSGTFTIDAIGFRLARGLAVAQNVFVATFTPGTELVKMMEQEIPLRTGDGVTVRVAAYTGTGSLEVYILYRKESSK